MLQWITIGSEQAILMSLCLQDMVDELVMKKKGARIKRVSEGILREYEGICYSGLPLAVTRPS